MHLKTFVLILIIAAVFACCFVGTEGGKGKQEQKKKQTKKQQQQKAQQKGNKHQEKEEQITKSYLKKIQSEYVNRFPKNPEKSTPRKNAQIALSVFKKLCADDKKPGKKSWIARALNTSQTKSADQSLMQCCAKVNSAGADPEEFMNDCEDLVGALSAKVTRTSKYKDIKKKVQKDEQQEMRRKERKRNKGGKNNGKGWGWWGGGQQQENYEDDYDYEEEIVERSRGKNKGKNKGKPGKGDRNRKRGRRDVGGEIEEGNPLYNGLDMMTMLNARSKRNVLKDWGGKKIVAIMEKLNGFRRRAHRSKRAINHYYKHDDDDDNDERREKRASFAQGILFTFLVLLGLFFGAIAFSCFLAIFSPCFLFALAGTFIFGAGAWFCLKAAEAVIESSESVEHEYDIDFYGGAGAGGAAGAAYYDSRSYEYYDDNSSAVANHGGVVADHLHNTHQG